MLTLGWHGDLRLKEGDDTPPDHGNHDAAAAILRDGQLVAAIEEERLDRIKHSKYFPARAIRFCLKEARATLSDVDAIVIDVSGATCDRAAAAWALGDATVPLLTGRDWIARMFELEFGVDVTAKLQFCAHHLAHVYSAWYASGFSEGLAVCFDGDGDMSSGLIASCHDQTIQVLRKLTVPQSLGNFYASAITLIGYTRFDEYKVMGLAPYGDPRPYSELFSSMCRLLPDGNYQLDPAFMAASRLVTPRRKGEPFTQQHKDFAAALQATLERVVDHVLDHFLRATVSRDMCLCGGVAHNCTMNGNIARSGRASRLYVQPASHDAGNAIGAALAPLVAGGRTITRPVMRHVYVGTRVGATDEIAAQLSRWAPHIRVRRATNAAHEAAAMIASGQVIGWVQGRSEFGPRALGNRSILADPRPAQNRDIINAMVKKREAYRPFAPSVIQERLRDFFEVPESLSSVPFMVIVLHVRPEARGLLGAVTHVDGTARVQSVSREDNPRFHALIEEFGRLTGVPVVLNTSFNNNAEPIVDSVDDAVACYLTTGIDTLVVDEWIVEKAGRGASDPAILTLVPHLPSSRKLVRRLWNGSSTFSLDSTTASVFMEPSVPVSKAVADVLLDDADGASTIERRQRRGAAEPAELTALTTELFELWQRRAILLRPSATADVGRPVASTDSHALNSL